MEDRSSGALLRFQHSPMASRNQKIRVPFSKGPVATFLKRALLGSVAALLGLWGWLQADTRTLSGIRVAGVAMPRTGEPQRWLEEQARQWEAEQVTIRVGPVEAEMSRGGLGARRSVQPLAERLLALGRSGNPAADISMWWSVSRQGREVAWPVTFDRQALARFVRAATGRIERPPVVGTIDEQGWGMDGIPGRTLNSVDAIATLQEAVRSGRAFVELRLREIPPPDPVSLGPPDAALFAEEAELYAFESHGREVIQASPPPSLVWAPDRGPECHEAGEVRAYCQGPRRVPMPSGRAAALAEQLQLGDIRMVGHLFASSPDETWVRQASTGSEDIALLWPVPGGRFVRGFGYVRTGALRHKIHKGFDIAAPIGTPIVAMKSGLVAYADNTIRGYGNLLALVHGDAAVSIYAHCNAIYVFPGQKVRRGQVVAEVGSTGISMGPHLHFEYRIDGSAVDPRPLLVRR